MGALTLALVWPAAARAEALAPEPGVVAAPETPEEGAPEPETPEDATAPEEGDAPEDAETPAEGPAPEDDGSGGFGGDVAASEDEPEEEEELEEPEGPDLSGPNPADEPVPGAGPTESVPVQTSEVVEDEPKAPGPRPRHRWIYSNLFALRYNPLGLVNEFTTGYRYQLIDKDSVLFNESFISAQLHTYMTPAYARVGPKIDIQPLALLNLSATYDFTGYFSSFGLFQSFNSPTADWSDTELDRREESGDPNLVNYATKGHHVTLSALLQAKVKSIAVRDNLKFYWADYDLRDGDTVYYHQTLDILQPNRGWTLTNDADLLYLLDFGLTLGVRYTLTHAFYQAQHFQPTEPLSRPNGPTHRVGPAVLYTFFDRPDKRFNKPTLIVLVQWWAKHRFRTGQDVSQGVPYLVIGFRFQGDLLPDPASWNAKTEPKRKRKGRRKKG